MIGDWRPDTLDDIIGQDDIKQRLRVWLASARSREAALPHVIFYGPPGTGKTTISRALANERGVAHVDTIGERLRTLDHAISLLAKASEAGYTRSGPADVRRNGQPTSPTVLFIDEIHRMGNDAAEALYHPLEDGFVLDHRKRPGREKWVMPGFTLVGATTDAGQLLPPLARRVEMLYMAPYTVDEMREIVRSHATHKSTEVALSTALTCRFAADAIQGIARRSRCNPSIAVRLVREVTDWAVAQGAQNIDGTFVDMVMGSIGVGATGLNQLDRRVLKALADSGRPVGAKALAQMLGEMETNIGMSEDYLISVGAILRQPQGRVVTSKGLGLLREDLPT
jgi:Holliday junction DNA helicase RuvB